MALKLTRKEGQGVWVGDSFVRVFRSGRGAGFQVWITAPDDVEVTREEIDARPAPDGYHGGRRHD